jgi:hypothetical protein
MLVCILYSYDLVPSCLSSSAEATECWHIVFNLTYILIGRRLQDTQMWTARLSEFQNLQNLSQQL